MSWEEVRTRAGQDLAKRVDWLRYCLGLDPPSVLLLSTPTRTAKFFFTRGELPTRLHLLEKKLPREIQLLVDQADAICRHEFDLLGYEKLQYGPEINWHVDPVHQKTAPLKPWFKVQFLNFSQVGDHKVIWELNRHQHLVTLAKAACLTREPRYADELVEQWYSWQNSNPYPLGINWASTLEVAFRSISWLWIRNLLGGCPGIPTTFEKDVVRALGVNGSYIARFLSTYFSPNTHLLGEAVALLFIGTLCPEIHSSEKWQQLGWGILQRECERQVRSDGVYFEQSLYYHVYALDFLLHARILAAKNSLTISEKFDDHIRKMLDVVQALSDAGPPEGFGDDDGGRVFDPRRNRTEHMSDPLAIGATVYGTPYSSAGNLTEEAIWLLGEEAAKPLKDSHHRMLGGSFDSGGIYLIHDEEPCLQQMMIDAGPQGTGHSGHGHADALNIHFSLDQQRCLIDSGTSSYMSVNERELFRGTGAHNTMRVDKMDQAIAEGPFKWSSLPNVLADAWVRGRTFDLFVGSHDGYKRLPDPVVHRRTVFHVHGGFWFIHDRAEGQLTHELELAWHFSSEMMVAQQKARFISNPAQRPRDNGVARAASLVLLPIHDSTWSAQVISECISPVYGQKSFAPVLRLSCQRRLPAQCATLMIPWLEGHEPPGAVVDLSREWSTNADVVFACRYEQGAISRYVALAGSRERMWTAGPITSDARLVYYSIESGRLTHLILWAGTVLKLEQKTVLSHSRPLDRFEFSTRCGEAQMFSSDSDVLAAFDWRLLENELFCGQLVRRSER
jgi:hypothetical protein